MLKRIRAVMLAAAVCTASLYGANAQAAACSMGPGVSNYCSNPFGFNEDYTHGTYAMYDNGMLVLSGSDGVTTDYGVGEAPWIYQSQMYYVDTVVIQSELNPVSMQNWFTHMRGLQTFEVIPESVKDLDGTFMGCTALRGKMDFLAVPDTYTNVFKDAVTTSTLTINYTDANESIVDDIIAEAGNPNIVKGVNLSAPVTPEEPALPEETPGEPVTPQDGIAEYNQPPVYNTYAEEIAPEDIAQRESIKQSIIDLTETMTSVDTYNFCEEVTIPVDEDGSEYCENCDLVYGCEEHVVATEEDNRYETCAHTHLELYYSSEPTCTEDGFAGSVFCADCDMFMYDGVDIPALGHKFTSDNETEEIYCEVCNKSFEECMEDDFIEEYSEDDFIEEELTEVYEGEDEEVFETDENTETVLEVGADWQPISFKNNAVYGGRMLCLPK